MFWQRTVKVSLKYAEGIINAVRIRIIAVNQNLNMISVSSSFIVDCILAVKPRGFRAHPVGREKLCEA
jgi:hypothetical protein